jgi:hypothetical protein
MCSFQLYQFTTTTPWSFVSVQFLSWSEAKMSFFGVLLVVLFVFIHESLPKITRCDFFCPDISNPVCYTNPSGQEETFTNVCFALYARCKDRREDDFREAHLLADNQLLLGYTYLRDGSCDGSIPMMEYWIPIGFEFQVTSEVRSWNENLKPNICHPHMWNFYFVCSSWLVKCIEFPPTLENITIFQSTEQISSTFHHFTLKIHNDNFQLHLFWFNQFPLFQMYLLWALKANTKKLCK